MKIDKKWWKSTKNGENRQKMVLLPSKMVQPPSKMVLPPSKMVLPQAMAWVQYWFRVLSLKFCGKSKKNCGDISQVSPAFCMYGVEPPFSWDISCVASGRAHSAITFLCKHSWLTHTHKQGNYSLRRPPKLIIQQIFIKQIWATVKRFICNQICISKHTWQEQKEKR